MMGASGREWLAVGWGGGLEGKGTHRPPAARILDKVLFRTGSVLYELKHA